jgi:hypothetical protein
MIAERQDESIAALDIRSCRRAGLTVADQLGHARPSMTQDVYLGRKAINPAVAEALGRAFDSGVTEENRG